MPKEKENIKIKSLCLIGSLLLLLSLSIISYIYIFEPKNCKII